MTFLLLVISFELDVFGGRAGKGRSFGYILPPDRPKHPRVGAANSQGYGRLSATVYTWPDPNELQ
ncbi:MAG: hypothetical protein ACI8TX_000347 [Hyphomicrobiaceae bacterium]|jgi:hypothetical protein